MHKVRIEGNGKRHSRWACSCGDVMGMKTTKAEAERRGRLHVNRLPGSGSVMDAAMFLLESELGGHEV